jgi:4-hydroxybenzoate polyprenyltransferase
LIAARLGLCMVALQASIGALNDRIDAPRDAGFKPGKPIPAGLVSPGAATAAVVLSAVFGLALAAPSGPLTLGLAGIVLGIGYAYDGLFKGTAWSWLPFAVGIPILPVFGWLGATGSLPSGFAALVPVAVVGGAALAIANARADVERDRAAGTDSVAVRLGPDRSWLLNACLLVGVLAAAAGTLLARGEGPTGALAAAVVASLVVLAGIVLGRGDRMRRERAWELEAIGLALLAAAWLAGVRLGG